MIHKWFFYICIILISGLINPDGENILNETSQILKGLFFMNGNIGVGLDLGLTYHVSDEIMITASVLDLDYLKYNNEVVKYEIKKDFVLADHEYFNPTPGDEFNYWNNKLDSYMDADNLNGYIPVDTLQTSYATNHAPKFNASAKYRITRASNKKYNSVYRNSYFVTPVRGELTTEFGLQTYVAFHPNKVIWAITPFVSRDINKYLSAKLTYTYHKFSATNFGFGISTHFKSFNFYITADNLLNLPKWKDSNYQSAQVGMNFMFY
jgi:hypothetical protein